MSEKKKMSTGRMMLIVLICAVVVGVTAAGAFYGLRIYKEEKNKTGQGGNVSGPTGVAVSIPTGSVTDVSLNDVSTIVANVMPAMVSIECSVASRYSDLFGREYEQEGASAGSGVIIAQKDDTLYIATNEHVINGAKTVTVFFTDGTSAEATVKGSDANADLAVVCVKMSKISASTKAFIRIAVLGDSTQLKAGTFVIAMGNALGTGQSVTVGYISATKRDVTIDNITRTLLQTDAAINPGNSGGALVNANGEIVGINSAKYSSTQVEGTGYAIPISDAIPILTELMNREKLTEAEAGYLGISGATVTASQSKRFGIPVGVYVSAVKRGSPAEKAGLKEGDVIVSYNGIAVSTNEDLQTLLGSTRAGTTVNLGIASLEQNKYAERTVEVTLGKR